MRDYNFAVFTVSMLLLIGFTVGMVIYGAGVFWKIW